MVAAPLSTMFSPLTMYIDIQSTLHPQAKVRGGCTKHHKYSIFLPWKEVGAARVGLSWFLGDIQECNLCYRIDMTCAQPSLG